MKKADGPWPSSGRSWDNHERTVVWQPSALNRLAELWNNGPDRTAIRNASDRIDRLLQRDPLQHGEARDENDRILVERPLAVYFTVSEPDVLVTIFDVWRWGARP